MSFDPGSYGDFIWPAYAVSALSIASAIAWTIAAWYSARQRLAALERS